MGNDNPYLFPIRPGQQNYLAGTMGEMRGAHFHGGIDIKTGGTIGWNVYASADGYVSRIKVEGGGYGLALYLDHPALGSTTVYGHLDRFNKEIAAFVLKEQYQKKAFAIDVYPDKNLFTVKKGDLIAYAGNSGSSSGPHLHFEIRDSRQRPINPLLLGFSEIKDTVAPTVQKIALKTLNKNSRVGEQFGVFEFTPSGLKNEYVIERPIEVFGEIGLMVMAYDRLNDVPNRNGIPFITSTIDDRQIMEINIDRVPFDANRNVLCYRDYQLLTTENKSFQKLYIDDGNELNIFKSHVNKGVISIRDTLIHPVRVSLKDAHGNEAVINLKLKGKKPIVARLDANKDFHPSQSRIQDNTLVFMGKKNAEKTQEATVFANRKNREISPSYFVGNYGVYLWDLREGLPDSIVLADAIIRPAIEMMVPSMSDFKYYKDEFDLHFTSRTLFDTLYLKTDYMDELSGDKEYFEISEDLYPLRSHLKVILKPKRTYANRDKVSAYYTTDLKKFSFTGGQWAKNTFEFRTRTLGKYTLLADTIPPKIQVLEQSPENFRCKITDAHSGIKDFELRIDGNWVLMHYDPKNNDIWTEKLDKSRPFKGNLELKVRDNVNNETVYTTVIR